MKCQLAVSALLLVTIAASAQVASHAPTKSLVPVTKGAIAPQASDKPVARVNGAILTDRDLLREMYAIFPYAQQHGGFPKGEEADIRRGAMDMIVFEELVYQEATRRKVTVAPAQVTSGEREFRKQFHSETEFQEYLKAEANGDPKVLRFRVKRALMIDAVMNSDVASKAAISPAELRAYYEKNRKRFARGESYTFQTISILPPANAGPEQKQDARKRAEEAARLAKTAKTYQEFGLLAEKFSEDDFRVNMGLHKAVEASKLPPEAVTVLKGLKVGQVSGLIQMGPSFTIIRVEAHLPAGATSYQEVKGKLREEQQKVRFEQYRSALNQKLKKNAKVEIL